MKKASTFLRVTFLSLSAVSVAFNISSSHPNTNLPNKCFSHKQFLMSKYSSIFYELLHKQSHLPGFHIKQSLQNLQSSSSLRSPWHSSCYYFCFELRTFSLNPHLHSYNSCYTKNIFSSVSDVKLNTFTFIW